MNFQDYLKTCFDGEKLVESFDSKEQDFAYNAQRTWNSRHTGISFSSRNNLKYNQILFVEFGFGYSPELSYSHPCLLLSYNNKLCKVIPITSSNRVVSTAYHPASNPSGNKAYYLLPQGICELSKASALYVKQIRTISESRIIKIIDSNGLPASVYSEIRQFVFEDVFEDISYKYNKLQKENEELKRKNDLLIKEIENLKLQKNIQS